MSDLNLEWLAQNFTDSDLCLMNIGCADITDDSWRFQMALPNAKIYSFECAEIWRKSNLEKSRLFNLHYQHIAISNFDGKILFYCGISDDDPWQYRGRTRDPADFDDNRAWGDPYFVETMSLGTFCRKSGIRPNFLHIDVEGEEYNVVRGLDQDLMPDGIWLEYWSTYRDTSGKSIPFQVLDDFLKNHGYQKLYQNHDVLYISQNRLVSDYTPYNHLGPWTEHERMIQIKIWLKRYSVCKDESWPNLVHPKDFFSLPIDIQNECRQKFDLQPSSRLLA